MITELNDKIKTLYFRKATKMFYKK